MISPSSSLLRSLLSDSIDADHPVLTCELRGAPSTAPLLHIILPDSLEFPRTAAGAPSHLSLTLVNTCDEVVEWSVALNGTALTKQRPSAGAFAIESFLPLQVRWSVESREASNNHNRCINHYGKIIVPSISKMSTMFS